VNPLIVGALVLTAAPDLTFSLSPRASKNLLTLYILIIIFTIPLSVDNYLTHPHYLLLWIVCSTV